MSEREDAALLLLQLRKAQEAIAEEMGKREGAEKRAEEEKRKAEAERRKREEEKRKRKEEKRKRKEAEKRAEEEKKKGEQKAEEEKKKGEQKAEEEMKKGEQKAEEEKKKGEQKAEEERRKREDSEKKTEQWKAEAAIADRFLKLAQMYDRLVAREREQSSTKSSSQRSSASNSRTPKSGGRTASTKPSSQHSGSDSSTGSVRPSKGDGRAALSGLTPATSVGDNDNSSTIDELFPTDKFDESAIMRMLEGKLAADLVEELRKAVKEAQVEKPIREIARVHPVVFDMLRLYYHAMASDEVDFFAEGSRTALFGKNSEYLQHQNTSKGLDRHPDALFHAHQRNDTNDTNTNGTKQRTSAALLRCMQADSRLSVELKANLGTLREDALAGVRRDYACMLPRTLQPKLPYGYALIGDILHFQFVRVKLTHTCEGYRMQHTLSNEVQLDVGSLELFRASLFKLLSRVHHIITLPRDDRLYDEPSALFSEEFNIAERVIKPTSCVGMTARCAVYTADVVVGATTHKCVVKAIPSVVLANENFLKERAQKELANLRMLSNFSTSPVHCVQHVSESIFRSESAAAGNPRLLVYNCVGESSGTALSGWCKCLTQRTQNIGDAVKRDITGALASLHKNDHVFVDVHPGNILVVEAPNKSYSAYLIDFESMSKKGKRCTTPCLIEYHESSSLLEGAQPWAQNDVYEAVHDLNALGNVLSWWTSPYLGLSKSSKS